MKLLLPLVCSWLWRTAGRGGFKNALCLRKIIVPYIIHLSTGDFLGPALIAGTACLPITIEDGKRLNRLWLSVLGLLYGLGIFFLSWKHLIFGFFFGFLTLFIFTAGAIIADHFIHEEAVDYWHLFEAVFGASLGLAVFFSLFL